MLEEQWTSCAHGQWVTVTEIMVESRPDLVLKFSLQDQEPGLRRHALGGQSRLQLRLAGCLGHALEDIPNFSVRMRGSAEVKNCLKAHECHHLCKTQKQSVLCPLFLCSTCGR